MLGETALGDLALGDLADRLDILAAIVGTGTLDAVATTRREAVLADAAATLIYTAELHPVVMTAGRV